MSTPLASPAPNAPFVHVPQSLKQTGEGFHSNQEGWMPSKNMKFGFHVYIIDDRADTVFLRLEALHAAEVTFHLPADLLPSLARALIDVHHHLSLQTTSDAPT